MRSSMNCIMIQHNNSDKLRVIFLLPPATYYAINQHTARTDRGSINKWKLFQALEVLITICLKSKEARVKGRGGGLRRHN